MSHLLRLMVAMACEHHGGAPMELTGGGRRRGYEGLDSSKLGPTRAARGGDPYNYGLERRG
jgi:hypothetical protein